MYLKLRVTHRDNQHVHVDVFCGVDVDHLQNSGHLVLSPVEFTIFNAAQIIAQEGMSGGHYMFLYTPDVLSGDVDKALATD